MGGKARSGLGTLGCRASGNGNTLKQKGAYIQQKLERQIGECQILEGGCHSLRIPVTERTHAKISIPEALKSFFEGWKPKKWLADFG